MSIPHKCRRNQQSGVMETHAGEGRGRWGRSVGAEQKAISWLQQNAKSGPLPLAPPAQHSVLSLPYLEKSKLYSFTFSNFKPGFPVRIRPRNFPFPLALRVFYLGLKSITLRASEKGTEMKIQPRVPLLNWTEGGTGPVSPDHHQPRGNFSPYSLFPSLGFACYTSLQAVRGSAYLLSPHPCVQQLRNWMQKPVAHLQEDAIHFSKGPVAARDQLASRPITSHSLTNICGGTPAVAWRGMPYTRGLRLMEPIAPSTPLALVTQNGGALNYND